MVRVSAIVKGLHDAGRLGGILGMVAGIASGIIVYAGVMAYNWIGLLGFILFLIGVIMVFVQKKNFS